MTNPAEDDAPSWTGNFTRMGRCGHTITVADGRPLPHDCADHD